MQLLDKHSISKLGISELFLMEQAALTVVEEIDDRYSVDNRILIVVEGGNNGGDGLAVARLLKDKGYQVFCYNIGQVKKVTNSFTEQLKLANEHGVIIYDELPAAGDFDIVIDAIFGIGLRRMVKGEHAKAIEWMNRLDSVRIAIDIPSGIHATTGKIMGVAFNSDLTVTFGYMKLGMTLYPGADLVGEVVVRDIGFPLEALVYSKPSYKTYGSGEGAIKNALKFFPKRESRTNKGDYGHVLMVVGSEGMAGAAILAARSAYRSGCGLVKLITHRSNRQIIQTTVPEAIVETYSNEDEAYHLIDKNWNWADACLCGSGLSKSDMAVNITRALVTYASKTSPKKQLVLDGDSLAILGEHKDILERYKKLDPSLRCYITMTPHLKEMSYLSKETVANIKENMFEVADSYILDNDLYESVTIVLKDARSIVTSGKGLRYINMTGNNGMATAGSGDCLAGMLTAILAEGVTRPFAVEKYKENKDGLVPDFDNLWVRLATVACCLHGAAGDLAKKEVGSISLTASDIVDAIPKVMKLYDYIYN